MNVTRRRDALVLLLFLCFFVTVSSGRISSLDAGQQLQVATMLALTGSMSDDGSPGGPSTPGWGKAPNGRRYQAHDIGNVILMLPAAWVGGQLSAAPTAAKVLVPPIASRVGVSLTCAFIAAVACLWLFQLFSLYDGPRRALALAIAFPCTTIFLAYARGAWDVLAACCLMCGVLYYSAAALRKHDVERNVVLMAVTLAAACSFRYSLAPFMVPAALYVLLTVRSALRRRTIGIAVGVFGLLMLPSFVYNYVRTGSALRPGTTTATYLAGPNGLTGDMSHGLYGLFLSPNRGIFVFSPVLLTVFLLPFVWNRLTLDQRRLTIAFGTGALCYVLLIAKIVNWGAFGWGPRYLVPILPVLFAAAAFAFLHAGRRGRLMWYGLAVLSAVLTLPTAVVNWHLATTTWAEAANPDASRPYQQAAAWQALRTGLQGESLPVPADLQGDAVRATTAAFPDLLLARVAGYSRAGLVVVVVFLCVALSGSVMCVRHVMAASPRHARMPIYGRPPGPR